jgi:hypothetical protein
VLLGKKNSLAQYNMYIEVHQERYGLSEDKFKEQRTNLAASGI